MSSHNIRALLGLLLFPLFLFAQTPKPVQFIMDASGSMWGKAGAVTKIETARTVLGELMANLPEDQAVGLVAYGHRRERDCTDIEEILPISNTDKAAFSAAVDGLNPLGRTPLAQSATLVINQLRESGEAATVILLTDGIETCDGDLCQLVAAAKAEGIDFVLHIIGFDLGEEDRVPLACAAQAGEGLYLDAENAAELAAALETATTLDVEAGEATLAVRSRKDGELRDAAIYVYVAGTEEDIAGQRTYASPQTNPVSFHLPAGEYDVRAQLVGERALAPQWQRGIVINADEPDTLDFDFTTGQVSVKVTENGELHDATLRIYAADDGPEVFSSRTYTSEGSNPKRVDLSPGIYRIVLMSVSIEGAGKEYVIEEVEVAPGSEQDLGHEFPSGLLRVQVTKGGALCDAIVSLRNSEGRSVDQGRTYRSESSNPKTFRLSPGVYELSARATRSEGDYQATRTVTVIAGETVVEVIEW